MITKMKSYVRMTMFPMVIFVLTITAMKFGPVTPSFMENRAEASMLKPPEDLSSGIFSAIRDWRTSTIIRTSLTYDPSQFYKMSDRDLRKLFGEPSLNRREGQMRMIQYVHEGCVADFYYKAGKEQTISHYEIRRLQGTPTSDCLSDLLHHL